MTVQGEAASPSGLPVGLIRVGNRVIAMGVMSADDQVSSDVGVVPLDEAASPMDPPVGPLRPSRTWFEQNISGITGCVIVLGDSDSD